MTPSVSFVYPVIYSDGLWVGLFSREGYFRRKHRALKRQSASSLCKSISNWRAHIKTKQIKASFKMCFWLIYPWVPNKENMSVISYYFNLYSLDWTLKEHDVLFFLQMNQISLHIKNNNSVECSAGPLITARLWLKK